MKRKINLVEKRKVLLIIGGKRQLIEIIGFCGEVEALHEAVDFLYKIGASEEEIKRLLLIGGQKVNLSPYTTKQQALDQLAWLIIIQGKMSDIKERMEFLKKGGIDLDFLRKIISMALEISFRILKEKSSPRKIKQITDLISNIFIKKEHLP